jgi:dTDP-4-dehydrorhamnose 3,5-epimerase
MARFSAAATPIDGLLLVRRKPLEDARGSLTRLFCAEEFSALGLFSSISQINHSVTRRTGSIRGMHFQHPPHAEHKLVTCLKGGVFDVAVDLRAGSPTFLRWHGETLTAENAASLYVPAGFAHGFQAMTDDCELIYLHSQPYRPDAEGALNAFDPALAIDWPLPVADMSERDRNHPNLTPAFRGLAI